MPRDVYHPDIVYGYVQGAGLLADAASPEGEGPHPVVIGVHGGRWADGARNDATAIDVDEWAGLGYFAMSIDYRLVTHSPAPACYQDLMCAIRWVHAHAPTYNLDASRIFLIGHSAGGHLVSLAATLGNGEFSRTGGWEEHSDAIAGAVSVAGAYDLVQLDWGAGWMPIGEDWRTAREYASPITHVSRDTRPLLMVHSDDDLSTPIGQAIAMDEALENAQAPYLFARLPEGGRTEMTDEVTSVVRQFIEQVSAQMVTITPTQ